MPEQQGQPPITEPAGQPGTSEGSRWADHPFTGTWEAAIDRVEEVAAWAAARFGSGPPAPGAFDAAVCILTALPGFRDASVSTAPAVVWDIDGETAAVYHHGTLEGPVTGTWCTCVNWGSGLCEHVLVALAGTERPRLRRRSRGASEAATGSDASPPPSPNSSQTRTDTDPSTLEAKP
jgi:hypothetical protein